MLAEERASEDSNDWCGKVLHLQILLNALLAPAPAVPRFCEFAKHRGLPRQVSCEFRSGIKIVRFWLWVMDSTTDVWVMTKLPKLSVQILSSASFSAMAAGLAPAAVCISKTQAEHGSKAYQGWLYCLNTLEPKRQLIAGAVRKFLCSAWKQCNNKNQRKL